MHARLARAFQRQRAKTQSARIVLAVAKSEYFHAGGILIYITTSSVPAAGGCCHVVRLRSWAHFELGGSSKIHFGKFKLLRRGGHPMPNIRRFLIRRFPYLVVFRKFFRHDLDNRRGPRQTAFWLLA